MSDQGERDPLDEVARSNPVDPWHVPSASLARVHASVQREIATAKQPHQVRRPRRPRALVGFGVSGAVVAAAFIAVLATRPGLPVPSAAPSGPGGNAACVEQYSPATLANREWAFDGTVTEILGDEVTFAVNSAFRGGSSAFVTLQAAGMTGTSVTSAGGPTLIVGQRYLVAGEDDFVWGCGFTQPYHATVAAEWALILQN